MNKLLQKGISGSPVWQQIGKQGSLTEQYFVFANNAKQQITKPQILKNGSQSMVWDSAYRIGNIATDPRTWIYGTGGVQLTNDALNDSTPPSTGYGTIGATIKDLFFSEESNIKKTFGIENER